MMIENVRKFGRLRAQDKKVVMGAIWGAVATRVGLRVFGFRRWKKKLGAAEGRPGVAEASCSDAAMLDRARRVAHLQLAGEGALFFRPSCLEHSLILQRLLLQEAIPAQLRLGGRKDAGEFKAHAWVEVGETRFDNFNDPNAYVPFGTIKSVTEE